MLRLVDSHTHVDFPEFDRDREDVLARARETGLIYVINIGVEIPSSERSVKLAASYDFVYATVGVHPHDATGVDETTYIRLKELATKPKVVAIGEIGLDYYRNLSPREKQQEVFRRQIALARELKLPVVIHDRDAHEDTLRIVKEEGGAEIGGVFHTFAGDWLMAKEVLRLGFYLGISGPVTYANSRRIQDVVKMAPLDRLLLETDAPYLTPEPYRGKRNEPARVREVAGKIAAIKGISVEKVAEATTENAIRLFGLAG